MTVERTRASGPLCFQMLRERRQVVDAGKLASTCNLVSHYSHCVCGSTVKYCHNALDSGYAGQPGTKWARACPKTNHPIVRISSERPASVFSNFLPSLSTLYTMHDQATVNRRCNIHSWLSSDELWQRIGETLKGRSLDGIACGKFLGWH